jgi:hypothetical protein
MEKVYFVSAPGRIKIGFTRMPEKRLKALRRADMEELTVIAIMDGKRALESKLHGLLKDYRLRGEWFVDCPEVRMVIDEAVAGKHAVVERPPCEAIVAAPTDDPDYPVEEPKWSPEYQIISRLFDEAEASLARDDDKYEVRGRVEAALAAAELLMQQRGWLKPETHIGFDPPV